MVAVPQAVDRFGNAGLLGRLGVAWKIANEETTPDVLRGAVLQLIEDPEVERRLRDLKEETATEGAAPRAVDLIEAELPER